MENAGDIALERRARNRVGVPENVKRLTLIRDAQKHASAAGERALALALGIFCGLSPDDKKTVREKLIEAAYDNHHPRTDPRQEASDMLHALI